jgi:uncharacterized repeat protein (TIGR01451 family)
MTRRALASLVSLIAVLLGATGAPAQELTPRAVAQIQALLEEKAARTPVQERIDSQLLAAARMTRGQSVARGISRLESVWGRVRRLPGDRARVDIHADVDDTLLARLVGLGARVESAFPEYRAVRAQVPLARVEEIAALPGVSFVEPAAEATTNTGSATSQGDAAHRAPDIRALGLTGAGVKVGVLSDGVNSLASRQATGDLPPTCPTGPPCITVLSGQAGSGDEGTAMLEIVHDLAPSAPLYFATAFTSVASFAANIRALRDAGCTVIVDDVTYFNEGAFQDGPIAQAVNDVTATGVLYFSSAANSGNKSDGTSGTWEGDFTNSGTTIPPVAALEPGSVHSFAGANSDQLTLGSGPISLKWSDPLGLSANDYDLFVLDSGLTTVVAASANSQTGAQDPYEIVAGQASGRRVVVVNYQSAAAVRALRVDTNRGRLSINTEGSAFGHNAGESTISVAATDGRAPGAGNPFTGGAANPIQTYSSDGPRRIFYEPNGTAITPGNVLFGTNGGRLLQKPDITAADCVTTTTPGFIPFCGTSAAAPHAGAIAALLLSASPAPTPALVQAAMGATALDIEAIGADRDSGRGIVMANRAQAAADLAVTMTGPASVSAGANAVYTLTITHNGIGSAASVQVANPTPAGLTFVSNAGDCTSGFPCSLGTLTAGQTRTITATFSVPGGYSGANPFTTTATVDSAATDPVSTNYTSSVSTSVTVPLSANLSVSKTGSVSVVRGTNAVYSITVSNAGPDTANSVQVTDPTPAGLTFVSNSGDCTTPFPCSLGTIPTGATRTITATFGVPSGYSGPSPFTNTATVSSAATDPVPGNNSSGVSTSVTSQADLSVIKTGPASVARGASIAYTIVVTNAGPSDAGSVQVADPTPAGLTFVSNTGDCAIAFPCSLGTIPTGATRTITATFNVPGGYSGANPFTNTATVTSTATDPVPGNNSSSAQTTVLAVADLSIAKTGAPFATRGANLIYMIVVTNTGPETAAAVQVADPTPAGLTFVSNSGDCTTAFPCSLGSIPSGASRTITATFSVPADYDVGTPIANTATVSGSTADPDATNDTDTVTSLFGAYYTVTPCRLVDTRTPGQMPALQPGEERTYVLAGSPCGIPVGAAALSVNLTVTSATAPGNLRLYPADVPVPLVSTINFSAGQTRANNAIVPAAADGLVAITVKNSSVGTAEFILDVNGYFE